MRGKTYSRRELPPCPDADSYVLVKTKEGYYWRKKRGLVKPALLNKTLSRNVATSKISGPAASRILQKLAPFTQELEMGRITLKIAGLLMKTYHAKGIIDFSMFAGLEFNTAYPLGKLLLANYRVTESKQRINIELKTGHVQRFNKLVTDYYFDVVLLYGDARNDETLHTACESSALFSFADRREQPVELSLPLPAAPWMLLLKTSCLEGNELAAHKKHYGMKVIKVSSNF